MKKHTDKSGYDFQGLYIAFLIVLSCCSMYVRGLRIENAQIQQELVMLHKSSIKKDILIDQLVAKRDIQQKTLHEAVMFIQESNKRVSTEQAIKIAVLEIKYSRQYKVPLDLGLALSYKESRFDSKAVSYNSVSYGLKQVNKNTWAKEIDVIQLKDLEYNTSMGYKILKQYHDATGSWYKATMRYYGSTKKEENVAYADDVVYIRKRVPQILRNS